MQDDQNQFTTPATLALEALEVPFRVFHHTGPIHSLEQAAAERGQNPEQVIRSIVFRLGSNEYLMALVAGPQQISWPTLRQYLGQSRLTMASPVEVKNVTGYETGTVSPFGLPEPLRTLADPNIFQPEEVSLGSGKRGLAIILEQNNLRRALGKIEEVSLLQNS
jgi:Cys-tRNA(Pro)/Cys-tRNA(Cys) deacylase